MRRAAAASLVAAIATAASAASAATIVKGPYLQALSESAVTIKLELDDAAAATVVVRGPDGKPLTIEDGEKKTFHAIVVSGLTPATTYAYEVSAGGASAKGSFGTAPIDARPFKFIVYGDSRTDADAHAAVVAKLREASGDFLVNTGDYVAAGGDAEGWQEFFHIEKDLLKDRCVFACIGNHEMYPDAERNGATFKKYFGLGDGGALYSTFRWGNTRFFLLNAMDSFRGEEKAWLERALASALDEQGVEHRFVVLHWSPFSSGPHGGNKALAENGILDMFEHGKVELLLAGHDHIYERGEGHGIKYLISGGAGAPLYPKKTRAPETERFESVHHFLEMSVAGKKVSFVARAMSGATIEACSFEGSSPWSCEGEAKPASAKTDPRSEPALATPPRASSACACDAVGAGDHGSGLAWTAALAAAAFVARKRRLPMLRRRR